MRARFILFRLMWLSDRSFFLPALTRDLPIPRAAGQDDRDRKLGYVPTGDVGADGHSKGRPCTRLGIEFGEADDGQVRSLPLVRYSKGYNREID